MQLNTNDRRERKLPENLVIARCKHSIKYAAT